MIKLILSELLRCMGSGRLVFFFTSMYSDISLTLIGLCVTIDALQNCKDWRANSEPLHFTESRPDSKPNPLI